MLGAMGFVFSLLKPAFRISSGPAKGRRIILTRGVKFLPSGNGFENRIVESQDARPKGRTSPSPNVFVASSSRS